MEYPFAMIAFIARLSQTMSKVSVFTLRLAVAATGGLFGSGDIAEWGSAGNQAGYVRSSPLSAPD